MDIKAKQEEIDKEIDWTLRFLQNHERADIWEHREALKDRLSKLGVVKADESEKLPQNIYAKGVNEPWAGEYSTAFWNGQRSMLKAGFKRVYSLKEE